MTQATVFVVPYAKDGQSGRVFVPRSPEYPTAESFDVHASIWPYVTDGQPERERLLRERLQQDDRPLHLIIYSHYPDEDGVVTCVEAFVKDSAHRVHPSLQLGYVYARHILSQGKAVWEDNEGQMADSETFTEADQEEAFRALVKRVYGYEGPRLRFTHYKPTPEEETDDTP